MIMAAQIYSLFLAAAALAWDLDPVSNVVKEFFPSELQGDRVVLLLRSYFVIGPIYESGKLVNLLGSIGLCGLRMLDDSLTTLKKETRLRTFGILYACLTIVSNILLEVAGEAMTMIVSYLFFLNLFFTYATLKLFLVIPMPMFLVNPVGMLLSGGIIQWAINPSIQISDKSKDLIIRKRFEMTVPPQLPMHRKYKRMKLRVLKQISFRCGLGQFGFFRIHRVFKVKYFEATIYHTTNMVMTIPTSAFEATLL
jgi:hypothetical protein